MLKWDGADQTFVLRAGKVSKQLTRAQVLRLIGEASDALVQSTGGRPPERPTTARRGRPSSRTRVAVL